MLYSLALIFLVGLALGSLCARLRLPPLLGMIVTGIVLGPYALGLLDGSILQISAELRRIALVIILLRAGLSLRLDDLRRVGRPAVLMCFVPATFEIAGMLLLAPRLLGVSRVEAAVLGAVVGAVSPAVIVPKMLHLMDEGLGTRQGIPQLILAGASVDDVYVIVLFTVFTGLAQGGAVSVWQLADVPLSILTGVLVGAAAGAALALLFRRVHMRDTIKVLLLLSAAFLLCTVEDRAAFPFSGLLAVMAMGVVVQRLRSVAAARLSVKFSKLWVGAEVLLFVLVGATVNLSYAVKAGPAALALVCGVLVFRAAGVWLSLLGTALTRRERLFCVIAYLPKATVQAAIGGVPLAMGLPCGETVLTVAVLSILLTAPLGAFGIDRTCRRLLQQAPPEG